MSGGPHGGAKVIAAADRIAARAAALETAVSEIWAAHRPHISAFSGRERCLHCGYVWPCPTVAILERHGL